MFADETLGLCPAFWQHFRSQAEALISQGFGIKGCPQPPHQHTPTVM